MSVDALTRRAIALALEEDFGPGDVTSSLIDADATGRATVRVKSPLVLAGQDAFTEVFRQVDASMSVRFDVPDGTALAPGDSAGEVSGSARSILMAERTALNLLQRMCGIASMSRRAADAVAGTKARVVDTRKTTPAWRALEKAAVRAGGCHNHRFGLFDGVLIKDNHVASKGGVRAAIEAARLSAHHLLKIECEVDSLEQLEEALAAGADVVLLDNMDDATMTEAVRITAGRAILEASGGVTLDRLPSIAKTGVDLISMGALTHSAKAADISLDWVA
ncbi:MAG: carboxylating nicotinate-nucleotide diphosphorylase [Deltaproteobacteria bacterium]